jgi:pyruvate,water dikinase
MYRSIAFFLVCFCFSFDVVGQNIVRGAVYNALTRYPVSDVQVEWGEKVTQSDFSGNFHFVVNTPLGQDLQFSGNVILWQGEESLLIDIYTLDGVHLYHHRLQANTSTQLPDLPAGIHLLSLHSQQVAASYKVLSTPEHTVSVDKKATYYLDNEVIDYTGDTLLIEKSGFLSRKVPVSEVLDRNEIGLLPEDFSTADYVHEVNDPIVFETFGSEPSRTNRGDVQELKFVYDLKKQEMYYMNSRKWALHYDFVTHVLGYNKGLWFFNATQYRENKERRYILGGLNYYQGIATYVIQYEVATELTCDHVKEVYEKIEETFYPSAAIRFYPIMDSWKDCEGVPKISSEELYEGQLYQGLNLGETYGYLRKIAAKDIGTSYISRRELVLTDDVPNDLPVVAGIITSTPQTPLSHINVLSHNRGTPNMSLKDAWNIDSLQALEGKLVYLSVRESTFEIREAGLEEAEAFWQKVEPQVAITLSIDTTSNGLVDLETANLGDVDKIGGKAANFAELLKINQPSIPTPENPFAIPFYYYHQHLKTNGIDTLIERILSEERFQSDIAYRKEQLVYIQDVIRSASIDPQLVNEVRFGINDFLDFEAYRFRSSTNAEDLEFFSGAGLYDSYSAKKDHETKTIENAIRKVWASLWNYRAYEEREYFKINHLSCAMGILVHRSFPDEDANGVLITKNLYGQNPGFIINVQYGEESIVFPRPGILHDLIILFTWSIVHGEEFMIEYLTFSNVPELNGNTVMTDDEIEELGRYAKVIKRHYYYNLPHSCDCIYDDFGVDIEFKVDSEVSPRKIYVKQARLYK